MLKIGTVTKVDHAKALAKITFAEEQGRDGGNKFAVWLPMLHLHTKDDKYYTMPDKGELVACMMDETWETGVIMGALYSNKNKPPSEAGEDKSVVKFKDGTVIKYDRAGKKLDVTAVGDITITASSGTVHIEATTVELKATTANIEATTATIKASAGTASLLDTFTGLTSHLFVPA